MTNKELINKVIDKLVFTGLYTEGQGELIKRQNLQNSPASFLFSHDVAKSMWGEQIIDDFGHIIINNNEEESEMFPFTNQEKSAYYREQDVAIMQKVWQYHLQQMVLEEDHLNYLRKTQEVWDV